MEEEEEEDEAGDEEEERAAEQINSMGDFLIEKTGFVEIEAGLVMRLDVLWNIKRSIE